MPQLILEYSENVIEQAHLSDLLQQLHGLLAETLPTDLASCKSRAIGYKVYSVGDGQANTAFIHLNLKVMPGRTENTLQHVGERIMKLLSSYFAESLQKLTLQITLEISELQATYFKIVSKQ
jgi:5-carboxymethyl-2-hydroxymuconate isomerase